MQHRAIRLMASKLAVAGIIEGNISDEGLAAMSDCADMTTALARELTQGIKDEIEDLSAVFKKMAILKPEIALLPEDTVLQKFMRFKEKYTSLNLPDTAMMELIESFVKSESEDLTASYIPNQNDLELLELAGVG